RHIQSSLDAIPRLRLILASRLTQLRRSRVDERCLRGDGHCFLNRADLQRQVRLTRTLVEHEGSAGRAESLHLPDHSDWPRGDVRDHEHAPLIGDRRLLSPRSRYCDRSARYRCATHIDDPPDDLTVRGHDELVPRCSYTHAAAEPSSGRATTSSRDPSTVAHV